jgi:hypothetical protein
MWERQIMTTLAGVCYIHSTHCWWCCVVHQTLCLFYLLFMSTKQYNMKEHLVWIFCNGCIERKMTTILVYNITNRWIHYPRHSLGHTCWFYLSHCQPKNNNMKQQQELRICYNLLCSSCKLLHVTICIGEVKDTNMGVSLVGPLLIHAGFYSAPFVKSCM